MRLPRWLVGLGAVTLLGTDPAVAQIGPEGLPGAAPAFRPVAGRAVRSAASPPVRSITPAPPPAPDGRLRQVPLLPLPSRRPPKTKPRDVERSVQSGPALPSMPAPTLSFEGLSNADNVAVHGFPVLPPDPNGDVGPAHYVQSINLLFRVFDKATGLPLTPALRISDLFTGFGGPCETTDDGDPIVLYDHLADRWLLSQFARVGPPFHQCIAISQTGDPTGAYFLYDFVMPNAKFNDYPKFGVWPDAYYMTDNQFAGSTFAGAGVFAFDRITMVAGDPTASFVYFDLAGLDPSIGGMLPADLDGPPPPPGTPSYFAYFTATEFGDPQDGLRIFEFRPDFTSPASSTFTERADSPVVTAAFDPTFACGSSGRDCIPQPPPAGSAARLDAIADRLMFRLQYRNFGGHESLVVNHTVDADGTSHAGVRYYEVRRTLPAGGFAVTEQATFAPDADHRWMGSAAMDGAGNLAVGYSVSSASTFPSIRYAGRLASDPPNALAQGEATLVAGGGSQTSTASRWGDYSMLAVDPDDDCTFWYTTEYYEVSSVSGWQTRVGTFGLAGCTPPARGTLRGTVTSASTGLPIAGALVKTASGFVRSTDAAGGYSMALPPGSYDVTTFVSGCGFAPATVSGVTVSASATTTRDFALSPEAASALSVAMTDSPDPVPVGNLLTYTSTVTNGGPSTATGVTLVSALPAGIRLFSATASQGTCSGTGTVTCALGGLATGGDAIVTIKARPTVLGRLTNTVSVSADECDPAAIDNSATTTTTVKRPAFK